MTDNQFVKIARALRRPHYLNKGEDLTFTQVYDRIINKNLRHQFDNAVRDGLEMVLGVKIEDIFMPAPADEATRYLRREVLEICPGGAFQGFKKEQEMLLDIVNPLYREVFATLDHANLSYIEYVMANSDIAHMRDESTRMWEGWRKRNKDSLYAYAFARSTNHEKHVILELFDLQEKMHEKPSE